MIRANNAIIKSGRSRFVFLSHAADVVVVVEDPELLPSDPKGSLSLCHGFLSFRVAT